MNALVMNFLAVEGFAAAAEAFAAESGTPGAHNALAHANTRTHARDKGSVLSARAYNAPASSRALPSYPQRAWSCPASTRAWLSAPLSRPATWPAQSSA
jgi:hypothetical protein